MAMIEDHPSLQTLLIKSFRFFLIVLLERSDPYLSPGTRVSTNLVAVCDDELLLLLHINRHLRQHASLIAAISRWIKGPELMLMGDLQ